MEITESELLKRVLTRAYAQHGVRGLLQTAFEELSAVLGSSVIIVAARDRRRAICHMWQIRRTSSTSDVHILHSDEAPEDDLFFMPDGEIRYLNLESGTPATPAPGPFVMAMSPRSLVATTIGLWDKWDAAVICLDPEPPPGDSQLHLARAIVNELRGPALHAYDLSRFRNRIKTAERARLARDLHDGVLQALIGLELKTHALRERIAPKDPDLAAGLGQLQRALRKEATDARKLMQDLRATVVEPHELAEAMAAATMKFEHDSGIVTTFESSDQQAAVSGRVSVELTRILQEALSNVRRHSRAKHVTVRLDQSDGSCRLAIADDGAGFSFAGRRTLDELTQSRSGPATIMERVRLLGGQLFVESFPTRGSRLEIVVPPGGRP